MSDGRFDGATSASTRESSASSTVAAGPPVDIDGDEQLDADGHDGPDAEGERDREVHRAVIIGPRPTPGEVRAQVAARATQHFIPPNFWHHGAPPLKEIWNWARYGEHVPEDAAARMGSRSAAWVSLALCAVWLSLDWLSRRLSRLVAGAGLMLVVILVVF